MKRNFYVIYGVLCGGVSVALVQQGIRLSTPQKPKYVWLLPSLVKPQVLSNATEVRAYRVVDNETHQYNEYYEQMFKQHRVPRPNPLPGVEIEDRRIVEGPVILPKSFAKKLNATLTTPGQFTEDCNAFNSEFSADVIFLIIKGQQTQELQISFADGKIASQIYTDPCCSTTSAEGAIGPGFLTLAEEAFPNDADLKSEQGRYLKIPKLVAIR
jgi:hypothetical protein